MPDRAARGQLFLAAALVTLLACALAPVLVLWAGLRVSAVVGEVADAWRAALS